MLLVCILNFLDLCCWLVTFWNELGYFCFSLLVGFVEVYYSLFMCGFGICGCLN